MKNIKIFFNMLLIIIPLATFLASIMHLDSTMKISEATDDIFGSSMDAYITFLFLLPTILAEIDLIYNIKSLIVNRNSFIRKIVNTICILLSLMILFLVVCCYNGFAQYFNISINRILDYIIIWSVLYTIFFIFRCIKTKKDK